MRNLIHALTAACVCAVLLLTTGCGKSDDGSGTRRIVIGLVAKSQDNDVFQAAYAGARDAARTLGEKEGVQITIDWRTPVSEDAAKQAEAIEALTRAGVHAIAVSCSEARTVTPAINRAVDAGIIVMCFDSDAPDSKRHYFYGSDDRSLGRQLVQELAAAMGESGTVAMIGGNQSAPNLQIRIAGAREELAKYPDMKLLEAGGGVFYHIETPEKAAEAVTVATNANPSINGWVFTGGWPLFTSDALRWPPGSIKVVSCDALPAQLGYLRSGHVEVLLAQDCYGWGHKSVEVLLDKVLHQKDPPDPRLIDPLTRVTKDNVDEFAGFWDKWLGK
jgi:ribose transport system substrate-binding protein